MASHFAGELVGMFKHRRKALPAISISDMGMITAVSNDFGYDHSFARQVEAYGKKGDVLICLTTSDTQAHHSVNLLRAIDAANERGMTTVIIGSYKTDKMAKLADLTIKADGMDTAEIQEYQLKIIHETCEQVEEAFL